MKPRTHTETLIQIAPNRVSVGNAAQIAELRDQFERQHCVVFPKMLSGSLVDRVLGQVASSRFESKHHTDYRGREFAQDLTIRGNELPLHLIHFLLNDAKIFQVIEQITGCSRIGSFRGRIYQNLPNTQHELDWHDDLEEPARLLGLSINLSSAAYSGGVFQLREKASQRIVCEVGCGGLGDAHLFAVSPWFQHRVTRTEGAVARTSAAGWFLSAPERRESIRSLYQETIPVGKKNK